MRAYYLLGYKSGGLSKVIGRGFRVDKGEGHADRSQFYCRLRMIYYNIPKVVQSSWTDVQSNWNKSNYIGD